MKIIQTRTSVRPQNTSTDGYAPTAKRGNFHSAARDYLVAANTLARLARRFPGGHVEAAFREAATFCRSLWRSHEICDSVDTLLYYDVREEYANAFNEPL